MADEAGNEKRLLILRVSNKGRGPITEIIVKLLESNEEFKEEVELPVGDEKAIRLSEEKKYKGCKKIKVNIKCKDIFDKEYQFTRDLETHINDTKIIYGEGTR